MTVLYLLLAVFIYAFFMQAVYQGWERLDPAEKYKDTALIEHQNIVFIVATLWPLSLICTVLFTVFHWAPRRLVLRLLNWITTDRPQWPEGKGPYR